MPWPRSIRFRYSLRALLVFLTLFGIWGGYHTNHGMKERWAVGVLRKHGATISYDAVDQTGLYWQKRIYTDFVRRVWREPFVKRVYVTAVNCEVLKAIEAMPNLDQLGFGRALTKQESELLVQTGAVNEKLKMPEGALRQILRNHSFKSIGVLGCILSDDDCSSIHDHESLEGLWLTSCELSEDGFANLMTLPRLRDANASYCNVTGGRLAVAPGSTSLSRVDTKSVPLTPEFARWLGRCPNVEFLQIHSDSVNDEFLARLGPHPSLSQVYLYSANVTDSGFTNAAEMPRLQVLGIDSPLVTARAKQRLTAKRPDIRVP